jgi:DNA-binding transcriptional LysR family regulator
MTSPDHPTCKLPDVGQLKAALAVWRNGGVRRAADRIGLTQPAVSRLVAALEEELGFTLFERERKRLTVSERGRAFLLEVEAELGGLARLSELAATMRQGHRSLLRIAAVPALAHGLVPRVLAALQAKFPDFSVEVEESDRERQIEGLLSRHLDIGLVALPSGVPELQVEMLVEADAVCLLPAAHPLAKRRSVNPTLLADERFIRLNEMRLLQRMVDDAFSRAGKTRLSSVVVSNMPLMTGFVAGGLGLAITHSLSTLVLPKEVVAIPFLPRLTFGYGAMTRKDKPPTPLVSTFVALARQIGADALRELEGEAVGRK